jgi:tRNA-dihydrouridine synthase A
MHAPLDRRLSVAPMMDYTTRDFRYLLRLISRRTLLYTDMVVDRAVCEGDRAHLLDHDPAEHPLALQLGGSDPAWLAAAAAIASDWGYDEINLNVGCPSDRVQSATFGACLMAEPERVADAVAAMRAPVQVPVTVKTRIGIDDRDDYDFLFRFVEQVYAAGCRTFIVHARKAVLGGLSPKENREIPPLLYERVYQLKRDFPDCEIVINGGIDDLGDTAEHLRQLDGVMIGREACRNPWFLARADERIFGDPRPLPGRHAVAEQFRAYLEARRAAGADPRHGLRHAMHLFQGQPGARAFRRYLSDHIHRRDATPRVLTEALSLVPPDEDAYDEGTTAVDAHA